MRSMTLAAGGEHHDRHAARLAHLAADGEAVHARQHHVEHDDVGRLGLERAQAVVGVCHGLDREAEPAQVLGEQLAERLVVVDQQHSRVGRHPRAYDPSGCAAQRVDRRQLGRSAGGQGAEAEAERRAPARARRRAAATGGRDRPRRSESQRAACRPRPAPRREPSRRAPARAASPRNCSSTSRGRAPTAIRSPISAVRSFTESSISARMPGPADQQRDAGEARGEERQRADRLPAASPAAAPGPGRRSRRGRLPPSRWRSRSSSRSARSDGRCGGFVDADEHRRQPGDVEHTAQGGAARDEHGAVLVGSVRLQAVLAPGRRSPRTAGRAGGPRWPTGSAAPNSVCASRAPSTATRAACLVVARVEEATARQPQTAHPGVGRRRAEHARRHRAAAGPEPRRRRPRRPRRTRPAATRRSPRRPRAAAS